MNAYARFVKCHLPCKKAEAVLDKLKAQGVIEKVKFF